MRQVLFWIPIPNPWFPDGIPIYAFGFMLFLAFISCTWLAGRRTRKEGVNPVYLQDLAIWIFVAGILGARITYMIQYREFIQDPIKEFFYIWNGGSGVLRLGRRRHHRLLAGIPLYHSKAWLGVVAIGRHHRANRGFGA